MNEKLFEGLLIDVSIEPTKLIKIIKSNQKVHLEFEVIIEYTLTNPISGIKFVSKENLYNRSETKDIFLISEHYNNSAMYWIPHYISSLSNK